MDFYNENGYYYPQPQPQIPYDNGSNYYSYSSYPSPQSSPNYYHYLPTQSLVAYSTFNQYNHLGSTLYHSVAAPSSPDLHIEEEYEPHPYRGGYDIDQAYGKPLPPSDDICYPPSSGAALPIAAPIVPPTPKQEEAVAKAPPPTTEEEEEEEDEDEDDDDDDDDEDDDDDDDEDLKSEVEEDAAEEQQPVQVFQSVGEYNGNQNPHGYGLETFDLCENLFGYWPCLARIKKSCDACGNEIRGEDVDQWTKTADYLFGNPDPYREWGADEGGYASGNRVYANHQMQYQQQQPTSTLYEQAHQYGQNSWFP